MEIDILQFKKVLMDSGLVSANDIALCEQTAAEKKQSLGDILVSMGKLKDADRRRLEAFALGIPFVSLADKKIDFEIISLIPEPIARTNNVVAFNKTSEGLEVAMLDVADLPTIDFVKKKTGLKILPRLSDDASIKSALQQYKKSLQADFDDIIKRESVSFKTVLERDGGDSSEKDLKQLAEYAHLACNFTEFI